MDVYDEFILGWIVIRVLDSEDVPLNISSVAPQENMITRVGKKTSVRQSLEMFADIAEKMDDFKKLGCLVDSTGTINIVDLLLLHTSKSGNERVNLKEYVDRMVEGQKDIYYMTMKNVLSLAIRIGTYRTWKTWRIKMFCTCSRTSWARKSCSRTPRSCI